MLGAIISYSPYAILAPKASWGVARVPSSEDRAVRVEAFSSIEAPLDKPANFYLVEFEGGPRILVDAGAKETLPPKALEADVVVLTHFHWDHVRGLASASREGIPVCASRGTLEMLEPGRSEARILEIARAFGIRELDDVMKGIINPKLERYKAIAEAIKRTKVYSIEECPYFMEIEGVEVLECPGHSEDHICLVIPGHVFVGDNIVPGSPITLRDIGTYLNSMAKLMANTSWSIAHPGHGPTEITRVETSLEIVQNTLNKMRRLSLVVASIKSEWTSLSEVLVNAYYGLEGLALYIASRSLLGYIKLLEELGVVEVDRNSSPWLVRRVHPPRGSRIS